MRANSLIGLLFIDFERLHRLRVNGTATVLAQDPLLVHYPGAEQLVRLTVEGHGMLKRNLHLGN